jgi:Raf kinase inhibitor-like YbhB/YbcL family protein
MMCNLFDSTVLRAPADASGGGLTLTSPDIVEGATIDPTFAFDGFGGGGGNVSPAFSWSEPPAGTKSFALFCHDPDAPTGGAGFWHWLVIDIPASARGVAQGAGTPDGARLPAGAKQIRSDYGFAAWGGPCPPVGDPPHRYVFTVYALGVERIEAPDGATASLVGFLVNQNVLAKASLTGLYGR